MTYQWAAFPWSLLPLNGAHRGVWSFLLSGNKNISLPADVLQTFANGASNPSPKVGLGAQPYCPRHWTWATRKTIHLVQQMHHAESTAQFRWFSRFALDARRITSGCRKLVGVHQRGHAKPAVQSGVVVCFWLDTRLGPGRDFVASVSAHKSRSGPQALKTKPRIFN